MLAFFCFIELCSALIANSCTNSIIFSRDFESKFLLKVRNGSLSLSALNMESKHANSLILSSNNGRLNIKTCSCFLTSSLQSFFQLEESASSIQNISILLSSFRQLSTPLMLATGLKNYISICDSSFINMIFTNDEAFLLSSCFSSVFASSIYFSNISSNPMRHGNRNKFDMGEQFISENKEFSNCEVYKCQNSRIGDLLPHHDAIKVRMCNNTVSECNADRKIFYSRQHLFASENFTECAWINCSSTQSEAGAAICIEGCESLSAHHCKFSSCNASSRGGAISTKNIRFVYFNDCYFVDTTAYKYGGALIDDSSELYEVHNSNFSNCTSRREDGGAIWVTSTSTFSTNGLWFKDCSTEKSGGGMKFLSVDYLYLHNLYLANCSAQCGGGIYLVNSSTYRYVKLDITMLKFIRNKASQGSDMAIYNYSINKLKLSDSMSLSGAGRLLVNGFTRDEWLTSLLYVGQPGSSENDCGIFEKPCDSILRYAKAMAPNVSSSVVIYPGVYYENETNFVDMNLVMMSSEQISLSSSNSDVNRIRRIQNLCSSFRRNEIEAPDFISELNKIKGACYGSNRNSSSDNETTIALEVGEFSRTLMTLENTNISFYSLFFIIDASNIFNSTCMLLSSLNRNSSAVFVQCTINITSSGSLNDYADDIVLITSKNSTLYLMEVTIRQCEYAFYSQEAFSNRFSLDLDSALNGNSSEVVPIETRTQSRKNRRSNRLLSCENALDETEYVCGIGCRLFELTDSTAAFSSCVFANATGGIIRQSGGTLLLTNCTFDHRAVQSHYTFLHRSHLSCSGEGNVSISGTKVKIKDEEYTERDAFGFDVQECLAYGEDLYAEKDMTELSSFSKAVFFHPTLSNADLFWQDEMHSQIAVKVEGRELYGCDLTFTMQKAVPDVEHGMTGEGTEHMCSFITITGTAKAQGIVPLSLFDESTDFVAVRLVFPMKKSIHYVTEPYYALMPLRDPNNTNTSSDNADPTVSNNSSYLTSIIAISTIFTVFLFSLTPIVYIIRRQRRAKNRNNRNQSGTGSSHPDGAGGNAAETEMVGEDAVYENSNRNEYDERNGLISNEERSILSVPLDALPDEMDENNVNRAQFRYSLHSSSSLPPPPPPQPNLMSVSAFGASSLSLSTSNGPAAELHMSVALPPPPSSSQSALSRSSLSSSVNELSSSMMQTRQLPPPPPPLLSSVSSSVILPSSFEHHPMENSGRLTQFALQMQRTQMAQSNLQRQASSSPLQLHHTAAADDAAAALPQNVPIASQPSSRLGISVNIHDQPMFEDEDDYRNSITG